MTHEEQRIWLIQQLLNEDKQYKRVRIPDDTQGQKNLLRALMNVRLPLPISEEILRVQDEYLSEENLRAGVTELSGLKPIPSDKRIYLWQGDITTLNVDAIVNAANSGMTGCYQPLHGCIDNIIGSKAGIRLRLRCNCIMQEQGNPEPTGQAKITPAYSLPCRYVIHTVGPIVDGPLTAEHERLLASCYRSKKTIFKASPSAASPRGYSCFPISVRQKLRWIRCGNIIRKQGARLGRFLMFIKILTGKYMIVC